MTTKWSALSVAVAAVVLAAALHTAVYTPADSVTAPHGATPETHGGNDAQSSASAAPSEDRARSSPPATDATASAPTATSNTQPGHVSRSSTDASKTQSDKPSPASADASTDPAPTAESSPARGFYAVTSVSEVQGAEGTVNHRALLATRQPMVVRNDAVVAAWPASSTWTPEHVAAALPVVPAYAQPEQPDFITFHDGKPLEPWVRGPGWDAHNHKHNVSTRTLFGHLRNVPEAVPPAWRWVGAANASHAPGPHLYFSADLRLLAPLWPEALTATEPHAALLVPDAEGVQRNLWLGRAGVATHTHYDAAWNTFAQLHGCKRFTLFPPGSPLHLYPCLHPHLGHSQLRLFPNGDVDGWIDGLAERGFHAAAAEVAANGHVSAYEATLCAGDILLLPPFWYHHVLTLSDSISVNTWSDAPEYVLIHEVYAIALPFEVAWGRGRLLASAAAFLEMVLLRSDLKTTLAAAAGAVLAERWNPLFKTDALKHDNVMDKLVIQACEDKAKLVAHRSDAAATLKIIERANEAAALLQQMADEDIRRLLAYNYIEHVTALVSSPAAVPTVLHHCFGAADQPL